MIYITNKISSQLRDKLIHRQVSKIPSLDGTKLQSHIELVLDYANMWHSKFVSFSVRNIIFSLDLNVTQEGLAVVIPDDIKSKLERASNLSLTKENARKYLREFQEIVLGFQSKDFLNKLEQIITIQPTNCKIQDIVPSFKSINLSSSGYTVIIPSQFKIRVDGKIEDKEIAVQAVVSMDTENYRNLLRQEFQKLKDKTKKIKF